MIKKVLVVEDSEGILFALRGFFSRKGMEVVDVPRVEDALEKATQETFDLVMLDYNLGMGETKGWDLAGMLKKDLVKYGAPKTVGMSATISLEDPERFGYVLSDFDMFLQKPFDLTDLDDAVQELLDPSVEE